jgi:hypothetical protein
MRLHLLVAGLVEGPSDQIDEVQSRTFKSPGRYNDKNACYLSSQTLLGCLSIEFRSGKILALIQSPKVWCCKA